MRAGERVLTPHGLLGTIVRFRREDTWDRQRRRTIHGPWFAVVEHDDGSRRTYLEESLVAAEVWEDTSSWQR